MITLCGFSTIRNSQNTEGYLEFYLGINTIGHTRGEESPMQSPPPRLDQVSDDIVDSVISKRIGGSNYHRRCAPNFAKATNGSKDAKGTQSYASVFNLGCLPKVRALLWQVGARCPHNGLGLESPATPLVVRQPEAAAPCATRHHSMPTPSSGMRILSLMPRRSASMSRRSTGSWRASFPSGNVP